MRFLRLPPPVSRGLELTLAVAAGLSLVLQLWRLDGWPGLMVSLATIAAVSLFWPLPVPDDEGCLKCRHASIHHQGTCQACLRDVVAGVPLSTAVPCDRFRRWSPRTRWERFRGARVPASAAPAEQEAAS
jgi:hypothetical protein